MVYPFSARTLLVTLSAAFLACGATACSVDSSGLRAADAAIEDGNVADASDGGFPPDASCTGRELLCGAVCVDPVVDPSHCGSCDPCPVPAHTTPTCADGVCGSACNTGFVDCDLDPSNGCEADTLSDPMTCGGCGRPCPTRFGTTAGCTSGMCTYDCGGGLSDCDGDETNGCETNTTTDALHCGSCSPCAARAGTTATCAASACVYDCVAGADDCDGDATNGCEASLTEPATCGSCTNVCTAAPGASAVCTAGSMCGIVCDAGRGDCDLMRVSGCEVDLDSDEANCGGCGVPCVGAAGTVATCTMGVCTVTCAGGRLDCDGSLANGCEIDPTADPLHCGSCAPCPAVPGATEGCAASTCTYACDADFRDCDGLAANGCEVDVRSSVGNCGGCAMACTPPAGAAATCTARVCNFTCTAPFADCDALAGNGCERNTSSDPLHCSACGMVCAVRANATSTCTAGGCGYNCVAPFIDCDGLATTGCESNPTADPLNCGSCGMVCSARANATPTCTATGCGYTCIAPFEDCDGLPSNGCERNTDADPLNCGSCGMMCVTPANAMPTCAAATCDYACTTPFEDCDGLAPNGCERNTLTDPMNCASCGTVCPARANATPTCGATGCTFACTAGFADCDGVAANGCEVTLATSAAHCGMCGNACLGGRACVASVCGRGWAPVPVNAASGPREDHTAVWTGTEMIVWGGDNGTTFLATGARYTAATSTWVATNNTGAPTGRRNHTAVWTGTEMIIWGGYGALSWVNTGARYNPSTNTWTPMTTTGAPSARSKHSAVWTGTRMIVWGGWTPGGGGDAGDGASYDPALDTWTALSTTNDPNDRRWHTGTLAGPTMVVWGGETGAGGVLADGKRYDPVGGAWTNIAVAGDPAGRARHTAVWTGTYVVLWGGDDGDGGGYFGAPRSDGGRYDPVADVWATTAASPLAARARHTAVWSGTRMLVWGGGGVGAAALGDGASYDPAGAGTWTAITPTAAPSARLNHTAIWTGTEMVVWGGTSAAGAALADGARLLP